MTKAEKFSKLIYSLKSFHQVNMLLVKSLLCLQRLFGLIPPSVGHSHPTKNNTHPIPPKEYHLTMIYSILNTCFN